MADIRDKHSCPQDTSRTKSNQEKKLLQCSTFHRPTKKYCDRQTEGSQDNTREKKATTCLSENDRTV